MDDEGHDEMGFGTEREHYTQAMHRSIDAIEKRAKGLDLWGNPLEDAEDSGSTRASRESEK